MPEKSYRTGPIHQDDVGRRRFVVFRPQNCNGSAAMDYLTLALAV